MTTINKAKWIAGILLVFVIVLATNLIDKQNFSRIRDGVSAIYEQRVVTSDIIFRITLKVQEKEIALALSDSTFMGKKNDRANSEIEELMGRFKTSDFTYDEQKIYDDLSGEFDNLKRLEASYVESGMQKDERLFKSIDKIVHHLYELSKVQLEEGKRKMKHSEQTVRSVDLFTRIEIIFLVIMAVLIQVIILYKQK